MSSSSTVTHWFLERAPVLACAAGVLLSAGSARATESEDYNDFSHSADLTVSGDTTFTKTADGEVLRLTLNGSLESSALFATTAVDVSSFSTAFTFRMTEPGGKPDVNGHVGGDGFTFAVQPIGAHLGSVGQGIGIGGITPSVAVEFDTWDDDCTNYPMVCDPSSNHIGVDVDGDVHSVVTAEISPGMDDGNEWHAWVDYDGTTLEVRVTESATRPASPQLSYAIDIPTTLGITGSGDNAYVGFTAATGDSWQIEDILSWHYVTPAVPGGVGPTVDAGAPHDAGAPKGNVGVRLGGGAFACDQGTDGGSGGSGWAFAAAASAFAFLAFVKRRRARGPLAGSASTAGR